MKNALQETKSNRPELAQLESELKREKYKRRYRVVLRSTVFMLITVAAIAILVATLWLPVLQIYGSSMSPTLKDGQIVFSVKSAEFKQNDICAFYYNNKILVKRVIAGPGDWVNIDKDGTVYVNDKALDEPYLDEKAFGNCDIELPYQVPDEEYFMMGDHRSVSIDSRNSTVGTIPKEQFVGKIVFCCWPLSEMGVVK